MVSRAGIFTLFWILQVFKVDSMLNFQYMGCVNPWKNKEFYTINAYYTIIGEACFELCRDHRFLFVHGHQCSCANNVGLQNKLDDQYCTASSGITVGTNLGSALYCNENTDACEMTLSESLDPYPPIDGVVNCLGRMCGVLLNPKDDPSGYFQHRTHSDCIKYCAYERKAYAHFGFQWLEFTVAGDDIIPFCSCRDSATVTEGASNCNFRADDYTSIWSISCTTKYFPGNLSCLPMDQFNEENFGNKEEVCYAETPVTSTTTQTTTQMTTTTIHTTTTTDRGTTARTTTAVSVPGPGEICYCSGNDSYSQFWNVTSGTTELKDCPLNQAGKSSWTCEKDSKGKCYFTTKQPNYSNCHNQWLGDLATDIAEGNDAYLILQKLDSETNITNNYYGHEIDGIVEALQVVLELERKQLESNSSDPDEVLSRAINATKRGTSVLNNLIVHENPWDQIEENRTAVATKILDGSEAVGLWLSNFSISVKKPLNCEIQFPGILIGSLWLDLDLQELFDCDLQVLNKDPQMKEVRFPSLTNSDSQISFPLSSVSTRRNYKGVGVVFKSSMIAQSFPGHINTFGDSERDKHVNSQLLSYIIPEESMQDVNVTIVFRHQREAKYPRVKNIRRFQRPDEEPSPVINSAVCSFLKFSPGDGRNWTWDDTGCSVKSTNRTYTVCECNHLTSFVNLMDLHSYTGPFQGLELTTKVSSSLSALSLLTTIVLLGILREIRNDRTSITQNLCLSLMVSHLLILTVFDRSHYHLDEVICAAFGVVLHFTLLASFSWMALEGLRLCLVIIDTFRKESAMNLIYFFLGYGMPLVVVATTVTFAASTDSIVTAYAQDETCWLRNDDYIWAFTGPVAVVLLFNVVCLLSAVVASSKLTVNKRRNLRQRIRSTTFMTLSLSVLFGLPWILGYFIFSETPLFAYLFTIINGLQGVTIFLFRCVLNEPLRKALRRQLTHIHKKIKATLTR